MKLTKSHREALLTELDKATHDLEIQKSLLKKEDATDLKEWFEIAVYLAEKRIVLIRVALINDEIDY